MQENRQQDQSLIPVLKELSDIKSSLSVNTNETANIKARVSDIQSDIKEIKNDFMTRREFDSRFTDERKIVSGQIKVLDDKILFSTRVIYGIFSVLGTAFLVGLIKIFIK